MQNYRPYLIIFTIILSTYCVAFEPVINYPLHPKTEIYCDQGNNESSGDSHSYSNTLHALDLHSNRSTSAALVYAEAAGRVITHDTCLEHNTDCGNGFGNFVKIIRGDNVMVMNAHLETVFVKSGEYVRIGQLIGIEGDTGKTGSNNRHLHFSVHFDGQLTKYSDYQNNKYLTPNTIAFKMNFCQPQHNSCVRQFNSSLDLKCKRKTGKMQRVYSY